MVLVLDPTTRRIDGGSTLVGGSPLTVVRLSTAGSKVVDELSAGSGVAAGAAPNTLARRLLDLGLAHPDPSALPGLAVTAVIPVRDDSTGLAATLAHLGPVEQVLVVDDGSADPGAVERAARSGPEPNRTRVLRLERSRGPAGARQAGWREAGTDIVAFVDAGCEPGPGWLERLSAHLADPAVAAVAPRVLARPAVGAPSWLVAYERVRSPLDLGPSPAPVRPRGRVAYVPTAALLVRRQALEEVGGFDRDLRFGEDVDLVWRLVSAGWVVRYEPAAAAGHEVRGTLLALLRQRFDYGCSAALLAKRHGDALAPVSLSPWSAVAWGLAAAGHPVAGALVASTSTAGLARQLSRVRHPATEAARIAGGGHLHAGRLLAEACRRSWWPIVAVACLAPWQGLHLPRSCTTRARRAAVVVATVPPLLERRPPTLPLPAWLVLRLVEDLAYGAGVWAGAARARSLRALQPRLAARPDRTAVASRRPSAPRLRGSVRNDAKTGGGEATALFREQPGPSG